MIWLRMVVVLAAAGIASAQTETVQDLANRLTPEQKQQFDLASRAFNGQHFGEALPLFKQLLKQLPGDKILAKFASESALDTGDASYAVATLKPIAAADLNDWQATALLARACAETGDKDCRNLEMSHLMELHSQGAMPANMQAYLLERIKTGDNIVNIRASLVPWGPYKVYDLGQVANGEGKIFMRITIESSDGDQVQFAKENPEQAQAGVRRFSLDAYRETGLNANGQRTQTHFTYKIFTGQPGYDLVRQQFIDIINGKMTPISSRTGLIVQ